MAFCTKCGTNVADGVAFCPQCGQAQGTAAPAGPAPGAAGAGAQSGLQENVAGALCYALGWLTGLIFILIDKRPFVKFHAAQSLVVFGGLHVVRIVIGVFFGAGMAFGHWGMWGGLGLFGVIFGLISLASLVLWVLLMIKAFQGERFKIPVAGDIAESLAGK